MIWCVFNAVVCIVTGQTFIFWNQHHAIFIAYCVYQAFFQKDKSGLSRYDWHEKFCIPRVFSKRGKSVTLSYLVTLKLWCKSNFWIDSVQKLGEKSSVVILTWFHFCWTSHVLYLGRVWTRKCYILSSAFYDCSSCLSMI